ncbi:mitochondria-eating protein-like isoform X8 [Mytilus californianus]|uniref:mitochondria-eating protein-like isoform X8 n=1 Tax=Mytilus californianus TaxID=6549 RepID=UPI002247BD7B|nr:mitochondria-eating protein-like isoform X8 [Mytilus californianus]
MAESLRRLVNIGTFTVLQDKLERWLGNYHINTCDQNVARCCEIIELNAKVQGQLFKLLSVTAESGGMYGGASIIKSRLLPFLGQNFFTSGGSVTADTSLSILAESAAKNRELDDLQDQYEVSLQDLEADLKARENEVQDLRDELIETKEELNRSLRTTTSDKMLNDVEIRELRRKLADAQDEIVKLRARSGLIDTYERQVRNLKDELSLSSTKKSYLDGRDVYSSLNSYRYTPRVGSPLSIDDPVQRVRQQNLISRWNDMFSQDRLDAMDTLRRYSDDYENNQRIIFLALQEAFSVAKCAFRQFKMKVRANLAATHIGPETLEEAVQDYVNRNTDLYDLPGMVADVLRGLNRSPKIYLPPDSTFAVVQPFIREACKLAWQMSALAHPLDIAVATDAELFDNNRYRRSYDSEYTAPLVNHHIWPALMQGSKVLMKGEACTRRGASLPVEYYRIEGASRRSRSRSRSVSPSIRTRSRSRSMSPSRMARSRSPSPRRIASPYSSDPLF